MNFFLFLHFKSVENRLCEMYLLLHSTTKLWSSWNDSMSQANVHTTQISQIQVPIQQSP